MIKICKECGLPFEATNGMQKYCTRPHFRMCVVCGKPFEVTRYHLTASDPRTTCSRECTNVLRKRTNVDKYGGVAPASSKKVQEKMQATMETRYGVRFAAQSPTFKEKMRATTRDRFGVDWYMQTDAWRAQTQATSYAKYGAHWPTASIEVRRRTAQTCLSKYGSVNPMQSVSAKQRFIKSHMRDGSKLPMYLQYKSDPRLFIKQLNLDHKPTMYELSMILGVNADTVGVHLYRNDCRDLVNYRISVMEQQIIELIHEMSPMCRVDANVHNVISPNEIDIYLPEHNLGIECNPTATHNSSVNVFDREHDAMATSYHLDKTRRCEAAGVRLLHVFGPEWTHKREIVTSMIRNLIGCNLRKVYARNCTISEIPIDTCNQFLSVNHLFGSADAVVAFGLYYQGELVSVMSFNRSTDWELTRFCSLLNTTVVGGVSKLFAHFVQSVNPVRVIASSNRAYTSGTVYSLLGFSKVKETDPHCRWVNINTDVVCDEAQLTDKYVQLFDSGDIIWEWRK